MSDHDGATQYGTGRKTFKSYVTGLTLSLILTLTAFWLVAKHTFTDKTLYISIAILALVQLFTQVVFFLRLNASSEGRWNLMPFVFAILIVSVLVGGSLWIMYNLNYNMVH